MNANTIRQDHVTATSLNKRTERAKPKDITIDIFCESMNDYIKKIDAALNGRYELDNYDMQVISIAISQRPANFI